jgi:GTPase Era involved in 16S rRNA processing
MRWYFYDAQRWAARHERDRRAPRCSEDTADVLDKETIREELRRLLAAELPGAVRAIVAEDLQDAIRAVLEGIE